MTGSLQQNRILLRGALIAFPVLGGWDARAQSIVSGMIPPVPRLSGYAELGWSSGYFSDELNYDSVSMGIFRHVCQPLNESELMMGMGIGLSGQKIDQNLVDLGSLFGYEITISGCVSRDFETIGGYVVRPFASSSITMGYITNYDLFGVTEIQGTTSFPIDALDYYCGIGAGMVIDSPSKWSFAADLAVSRNIYGTFTDRSGGINHSFLRFQIMSPLEMLDLPVGCHLGYTLGRRDNVSQRELFIGLDYRF